MVTDNLKVFISHSNFDQETAQALVNLMRAALNLRHEEIRCTSIAGHKLPAGEDTDERLRDEMLRADAFIGIISEKSIASTYVLFELGGRWGAGKYLAPILAPGAGIELLKDPLSGLNALSCDSESDLHQLVEDIGHQIKIEPASPAAYLSAIKSVLLNHRPAQPTDRVKDNNELPLRHEHLQVLAVFSGLDDEYLRTGQLSLHLKWSKVKAQHYLEEMVSMNFVNDQYNAYEECHLYSLTAAGRARAVQEDLA